MIFSLPYVEMQILIGRAYYSNIIYFGMEPPQIRIVAKDATVFFINTIQYSCVLKSDNSFKKILSRIPNFCSFCFENSATVDSKFFT
jgi:hypothetical protein